MPATEQYLIVQAALPDLAPENIGVLLLDPASNQLYMRFRRDLRELADPEDAEVLENLTGDLTDKASEMGGDQLLLWLEENLSNTVRVSERESVLVSSFDSAADRLYRSEVSPKVLAFRTHLPKYSLRAAAGKFGEHMEVEPEDWEEVPEGLKLTEDMFIAHV